MMVHIFVSLDTSLAIDVDDGDVVIADSNELHGVTPISGNGVRLSCVAYCDEHVATKGIVKVRESCHTQQRQTRESR